MAKLIRESRVQMLALVVLAIAARVLYLQATHSFGQITNNDAQEYNQIAHNLLGGSGFAFKPGEPTAFRPFGYPWFLATIYATVGDSTTGVHWLQVFLGSVLIVPTYLLARALVSQLAAVIAGLGVALHPVLIYVTALIAPETVALLAEMFLLWFAWSWQPRVCVV